MTNDHQAVDDDAPTRIFWFHSAALTHPGTVRTVNEDAFLDRRDVGLWAVADGMGGYEAGEVASGEVVRRLRQLADRLGGGLAVDDVLETLHTCNDDLRHMAERYFNNRMGTTVVALLLAGRCFSCVWAGDSRLYRLRHGVLEQISRDHSYVQDLIDANHLDAGLAREHPQANAITRAIGVMENVDLDVVTGVIEEGELFLLCSDGLIKALSDDEIAQALEEGPPEIAVEVLLQRSLDHGARDNVTLVAIQCDPIARRS
jgi:serine/threonine protein phosphatase PrpC